MKKLLKYLTIAIGLLAGFGINVKAAQSLPKVVVSLTEEEKDIRDKDPFGWRMPAVPTTCTIDFETLSITSDRLPMALSYELWDEMGKTMVISYCSDYDMASYMSHLTRMYQLRLVSSDTSFIGYVEL